MGKTMKDKYEKMERKEMKENPKAFIKHEKKEIAQAKKNIKKK